MNPKLGQLMSFLVGLVAVWAWVLLPEIATGPVSAVLGFVGGMGYVHYTARDNGVLRA